jgi:predicted O-methyltransferase YrrM
MEPLRRALEVQGWMRPGELAFLYALALTIPEGGSVVEVGSWKGRSTVAIAEGLDGRAQLTAVDTFGGEPLNVDQREKFGHEIDRDDIFTAFKANTAGFSRLDTIRSESRPAAEHFEDDSIDWLFIDAEHTVERVTEDIRAWHPKIKPGGLITGHDYLHAEVRVPVTLLLGKANHWESIWFLRKRRPLARVGTAQRVADLRGALRRAPAVERAARGAWARTRATLSH